MKSSQEMKKLNAMGKDKLIKELEKEKINLSNLRLAVAARKEDNIAKIKKSKKRVARILTVLAKESDEKE